MHRYQEVMSVVKSLNTRDTTIIATIHSPTAYAFSLFNHAMILCSGMQVYFGPNQGERTEGGGELNARFFHPTRELERRLGLNPSKNVEFKN